MADVQDHGRGKPLRRLPPPNRGMPRPPADSPNRTLKAAGRPVLPLVYGLNGCERRRIPRHGRFVLRRPIGEMQTNKVSCLDRAGTLNVGRQVLQNAVVATEIVLMRQFRWTVSNLQPIPCRGLL